MLFESVASLVIDRCGSSGFVTRLGTKVLLPSIHGDTQLCKGEVTKKYVYPCRRHLVGMDVWCENKRHEITALGYPSVALATKALDTAVSVYCDEA